jgi:hypothetical protein
MDRRRLLDMVQSAIGYNLLNVVLRWENTEIASTFSSAVLLTVGLLSGTERKIKNQRNNEVGASRKVLPSLLENRK